MTQENLRQLAKQGNPKAIAALINQSLKPKNITAKIGLKDDCLQVLLESAQIPKQQAMVSFIRNGLTKLEVESIKTVKVFGRQVGEESPAWSQSFEMISEVETPSFPEPIELETPLSFEEIELETPSRTQEIDFQNLSAYQTTRSKPSSIPSTAETPSSTGQTDRQNLRGTPAMSENSSLRQSVEPLSVGNVVSAAVVLYRCHLKTYLQLALKAYLWILVPIYGWAKYIAISGMISRLAFRELTSQPESVNNARNFIKPRLWSFFRVAFQVALMLVGIYIGLSIVSTIGIFLVGFGLVLVLNNLLGNPIITVIMNAILGSLAVVCIIFGWLWFFSRWFVAEVPLAVEESINGRESIDRSWKLTKNSVRRILGVVIVAFLVTLPLVGLTAYLPQILLLQLEEDSNLFSFVYFVSFLTSLGGGILVLPFWQALKAVLYYDLCNRREGMGLRLRDSK
ncbi:MAG TPA: hypothetical protein V6D43_07265 [Candidatus Sericytochromatia bacterium]